jgi:hypothetical protein
MLMLMYVHRGVLPVELVAPVYTFGAPAVFCEGVATGCQTNCGEDYAQAGTPADIDVALEWCAVDCSVFTVALQSQFVCSLLLAAGRHRRRPPLLHSS